MFYYIIRFCVIFDYNYVLILDFGEEKIVNSKLKSKFGICVNIVSGKYEIIFVKDI